MISLEITYFYALKSMTYSNKNNILDHVLKPFNNGYKHRVTANLTIWLI